MTNYAPDSPVSEEAVRAINRVLRERLEPWGFEGADVRAGRDHDGDPVIYVDARYRLTAEPFDPRVTFGIVSEVRRALESVGEWRFPHVRHHFHERQPVMESFGR